MSCKTQITWEEPQALAWESVASCENPHILAENVSYNCDRDYLCRNKDFIPKTLNGIWIPPHKTLLAYEKLGTVKPFDAKNVETMQINIQENEYNKVINIPNNKVIIEVVDAYYRSSRNNMKDIGIMPSNKYLKDLVMQNKIQFYQPFNAMFGDIDNGTPKYFYIRVKIANVTQWDFNHEQYSAYSNGQHTTSDTQSQQVPVNKIVAATLLQKKPWKDHLRDCCFGLNSDANQCGDFNTTATGAKKCAAFLDECTADEKKEGGRCGALYAANNVVPAVAPPVLSNQTALQTTESTPADGVSGFISMHLTHILIFIAFIFAVIVIAALRKKQPEQVPAYPTSY